jgi:hypothetical protein
MKPENSAVLITGAAGGLGVPPWAACASTSAASARGHFIFT